MLYMHSSDTVMYKIKLRHLVLRYPVIRMLNYCSLHIAFVGSKNSVTE